MSDSKEFLGKTLDAAIAEACSYYDVPREKLEIEIIEDAKTGFKRWREFLAELSGGSGGNAAPKRAKGRAKRRA